jgi:hypothetical protein
MLAYLFVVFAVLFRLLPHTMGFTPVVAALLFFGSRKPRRQMWIPFLLLFGSDIFLTKVYYGYPLTPDHVVSWIFYIAVLFGASALGKALGALRLAGASLGSSVVFFIVSNFASWLVWYPRTMEGLATCYTLAIPFFRNAVAGDLFFTAALFGFAALVEGYAGKRRAAEA